MSAKAERTLTVTTNDRRTVVEYGFHWIPGNTDPYFYLTCLLFERRRGRWVDVGGGADHARIAKVAPKLAHLARWHLVGIESGPMHYAENARYWLEFVHGVSRWSTPGHDPSAAFKSTVCLFDDETVSTRSELETPDLVDARLAARLPRVMAAFRADIDAIDPTLWNEGLALKGGV